MACYVLRAMTDNPPTESLLAGAGLPASEAREWLRVRPEGTTSLEADAARYGRYWALGAALLERLPAKPARDDAERAAADALIDLGRRTRSEFLGSHATAVYAALTGNRSRFVRLEELCAAAAEAFTRSSPAWGTSWKASAVAVLVAAAAGWAVRRRRRVTSGAAQVV